MNRLPTTSPRARSIRDKILWAAIIFAVALSVRVFHLNQLSDAPFFGSRIGDAEVYHAWAKDIADGDWAGDRVFYQAPLYPYFLGAVYSVFGDELGVVLKVQALFGSFSCMLLALAAWRLFSKRAGIAAGFLLAFYGPVLFYESLLQKSVLDVFFLSLSLWFISELIFAPTKSKWWGLGMSLGALVLARENALVFVVAILIWIVVRAYGEGVLTRRMVVAKKTMWAGCFLAGLMVVLFPVALRNKLVGDEFHLTTSQLGPNLYIGNNPSANGTYQPLRIARGHARFERDDATAIAEESVGRRLTPGDVSAFYVDRVVEYIRSEPADWLRLMSSKLALTWNAGELIDTEDAHTYAEWSAPLRVTLKVLHFGVLAPLAALGLALTWHRRRDLWILYLLIIVYAASVALFFVFGRYRLPLVPLLILFAAAGVTEVFALFRAPAKWKLAASTVVTLCAVLVCNLNLVSAEKMQAVSFSNIGNALAKQGKFDEAIQFYERSLRINPENALAHNNLGVALERQGRFQLAAKSFKSALEIEPNYENARKNLARITPKRT